MFKKVSFLKLRGRDVRDGRADLLFRIGGVTRSKKKKKAKIYIDTVSE